MTSIDEAARLAAMIRAQMGAMRRRDITAQGKGADAASTEATASTASLGETSHGVSSLVLSQIRSLSNDPARPRRAFRIFLRNSLANRLGKADQTDASFERLVDQVMDTMMADEQLRESIHQAGQELIERAARR